MQTEEQREALACLRWLYLGTNLTTDEKVKFYTTVETFILGKDNDKKE